MLFVRVVRKKLNGKRALLMFEVFEVFEIPKINIYRKSSMCTSFCEFLSFDL